MRLINCNIQIEKMMRFNAYSIFSAFPNNLIKNNTTINNRPDNTKDNSNKPPQAWTIMTIIMNNSNSNKMMIWRD